MPGRSAGCARPAAGPASTPWNTQNLITHDPDECPRAFTTIVPASERSQEWEDRLERWIAPRPGRQRSLPSRAAHTRTLFVGNPCGELCRGLHAAGADSADTHSYRSAWSIPGKCAMTQPAGRAAHLLRGREPGPAHTEGVPGRSRAAGADGRQSRPGAAALSMARKLARPAGEFPRGRSGCTHCHSFPDPPGRGSSLRSGCHHMDGLPGGNASRAAVGVERMEAGWGCQVTDVGP